MKSIKIRSGNIIHVTIDCDTDGCSTPLKLILNHPRMEAFETCACGKRFQAGQYGDDLIVLEIPARISALKE